MNVGSLFSGIGGIDLGLERAGMRVVWQAESDPWCREILARHWPGIPCYDDVRSLVADAESGSSGQISAHLLRDSQRGVPCTEEGRRPRGSRGTGSEGLPVRVPRVDVLAGGFPCQPVSLAGKGLAQADARWLWPEFARLIRVLRPRYVIAENVPGLLTRGLDIVLADLAALRFDAEWTVFGARDVGAPHKRDRVWIVAWDTDTDRQRLPRDSQRDEWSAAGLEASHGNDANGLRVDVAGHERPGTTRTGRNGSPHSRLDDHTWAVEPGVGRVAHGVPHRVDRLRALGNAVVPACAEHIGRLVMQHARQGSA